MDRCTLLRDTCGCCSSDSTPNLPLTLQGCIFIDRSGALFDDVLSLLRDGPEWRPPEDRYVRRPGAGSRKGAEEWAVQGERRGQGGGGPAMPSRSGCDGQRIKRCLPCYCLATDVMLLPCYR